MRKKPPPDGVKYRVKDGEWVGSIAMSYGFADWEKDVWKRRENAELRSLRGDPHVLAEGDELFIPPWTEKYESGANEQRHRFKLKSPSEVLRIRVLGPDEEPMANEEYQLSIDCAPGGGVYQQKNQKTDEQGMLTEKVPSTAVKGRLYIPSIDYEIELDIGHLTPMDPSDKKSLIRGAQERLKAIGFDPGPIDGIDGPLTQAALSAFQQFCKDNCDKGDSRIIDAGPVDGIIGEKTHAALLKYFGS